MPPLISCQSYVWHQIYDAQGKKLNHHLEEVFQQLSSAGYNAWEQPIESPAHAANLKSLLPRYNLTLPSVYFGSILHTDAWPASVQDILSRARLSLPLGTKFVVCNPNPIAWGQPLDKSDDQLKTQSHALQTLSDKLASEGLTLAYHTHDAEMRCSAREFHHMLQSTNVRLCLDTHWIYRGSSNSQLALYDILKIYAPRLLTLHLRQSHNHIWSETFSPGDIDYTPLANHLKSHPLPGPLTLEQCSEPGTPQSLPPLQRHQQSLQYLQKLLTP